MNLNTMEFPLVTNAIPLYKSKPFVDIIIANIDAIDYPNVEILISDRHQYDDAIEILERRYHNDHRVTIIKAQDALTYAQHYNFLLATGKGKYFRWMPHDDSYPVCALRVKVDILEKYPEYVLVNGPWHDLDAAGNVISVNQPMKSPLGGWSYETSLFIAFGSYEGHAFKGLFRRDIAVQKGVWLFDTRRIISPERCWEFAMSLVGEFYNYTEFNYYKRYPAGSTYLTWRKNWKPLDILFTWYYKFRYQWTLDRKPLRIMAFMIFMGPMTLRRILFDKTRQPLRSYIKRFPGKYLKRSIRLVLSKL